MDQSVAMFPVQKMLPVPLTQEEKDAYTKKALDSRAEVVRLEEDKKAWNKANKEAQDAYNVRMDDAMSVLREGHLDKMVDCQEVRNYTTGTCCIVRMDTGEVVSERELTYDERQQALKFAPTMSLSERNQALLEAEWETWETEEAEREKAEAMSEAEEAGAIPLRKEKAA